MTTRMHGRAVAQIGIAVLAAVAMAGCSSGAAAPAQNSPTSPTGQTATIDEALHSQLPDAIRDAGQVIVGSPMSSPPNIFVARNGDPTGLAYDLSLEMGKVLGVKVVWQDMAFPGVIPGLQGGKIDLSMGVVGDTAERQKVLDFVDLFKNESALLTQKGNPSKVTDLASTCGLAVGVLAGSLQLSRVQDASKSCTDKGEKAIVINQYSSQSDGQAAVQSGRVVGFFGPYLTLNYVAQTAGDGGIFEMGSGRYPDNPFAIAMQKDRGSLAAAIQGALVKLVEDGTYHKILDSYHSDAGALSKEQILVNGAGTPAFSSK